MNQNNTRSLNSTLTSSVHSDNPYHSDLADLAQRNGVLGGPLGKSPKRPPPAPNAQSVSESMELAGWLNSHKNGPSNKVGTKVNQIFPSQNGPLQTNPSSLITGSGYPTAPQSVYAPGNSGQTANQMRAKKFYTPSSLGMPQSNNNPGSRSPKLYPAHLSNINIGGDGRR